MQLSLVFTRTNIKDFLLIFVESFSLFIYLLNDVIIQGLNKQLFIQSKVRIFNYEKKLKMNIRFRFI